MWERGLKLIKPARVRAYLKSLPMWERGLKQLLQSLKRTLHYVAPHVGAWIETGGYTKRHQKMTSLPMWERGLKREIML